MQRTLFTFILKILLFRFPKLERTPLRYLIYYFKYVNQVQVIDTNIVNLVILIRILFSELLPSIASKNCCSQSVKIFLMLQNFRRFECSP